MSLIYSNWMTWWPNLSDYLLQIFTSKCIEPFWLSRMFHFVSEKSLSRQISYNSIFLLHFGSCFWKQTDWVTSEYSVIFNGFKVANILISLPTFFWNKFSLPFLLEISIFYRETPMSYSNHQIPKLCCNRRRKKHRRKARKRRKPLKLLRNKKTWMP